MNEVCEGSVSITPMIYLLLTYYILYLLSQQQYLGFYFQIPHRVFGFVPGQNTQKNLFYS